MATVHNVGTNNTMNITTVPTELLLLIVSQLSNIEDLLALGSACRVFHEIITQQTSPRVILRLFASSAPTFCSPHPHFLILSLARQIATWTLADPTARKSLLIEAFRGGIDSLYDFCLQNAPFGLSLDQIRRMHAMRFSIINPLSDAIDRMAGEQWYKTPRFWNGGVSEAETLHTDSGRATMQILIYGELFGSTMDVFLRNGGNDRPLEDVIFTQEDRFEFIKYCIPDLCCRSWGEIFKVESTGPYAPDLEGEGVIEEDQTALRHILACRRWHRMWQKAKAIVTVSDTRTVPEEEKFDFTALSQYLNRSREIEVKDDINEEDWRERLYREALVYQGLEGMQLVILPYGKVDKKVLDKASWIRKRIGDMENPFECVKWGARSQIPVSVAPDLLREVQVASRSRYPGNS
ncbi:hypothetical protein BGW36DRAFT_425772 [Talaromyces proteolyticus]|uniref:F-box domain-containing protein n=1 Tax=Talaromyces proteolyticus TaxID=1131652 RepID=A0AAD4Q319_9EURO|nr:uncharacterized protein BGW36DRAFT_425772 [Talaromyces proteolyticus]KAH8700972.1 hypothetical protein BGW36DRAFT_425772 [Talaromyces proteolyticus]